MKRKITAKILIALSCISLMMPFYFTKEVDAAVTDLTVIMTANYSDTYFEEDPEDSRYMIGRMYISFNYSEPCLGWYYINLGTMSPYASGNIAQVHLFSLNGAYTEEVNYLGSSTYGISFRVDFTNLTENLFLFEYRVIKTVLQSHHFEFIYEGVTWDDGDLVPNNTAIIPLRLEEINDNIELIVLNNNLHQQEVEDKLDNIIRILNVIAINNGSNPNYGIAWIKGTTSVSMYNANTIYYMPTWDIYAQIGDAFSNDGKNIKCKYTGTVRIDARILIEAIGVTPTTTSVNWYINDQYLPGSGTQGYVNQVLNIYTQLVIPIQANDKITLGTWSYVGNANNKQHAGTSWIIEYGTDTLDLTSINQKLNYIIEHQTDTYDLLDSSFETIIDLLEEIAGNTEDMERIDLINQEINTYNNQINTITNNYNIELETNFEDLEFPDLLDVDPESEHNILNDVNFYNSVFEGMINIPYIKSILIFLLLCILIVAMVG